MKQLKRPGVEHEFREQSPGGQARELGLGKKPESFAQLESNEETHIPVEKRNLQDSWGLMAAPSVSLRIL